MANSVVRDTIARFIQSEGHKVDVSTVDPTEGVSEILFRTRGQVFSVTTYEEDPGFFTISTAYEIPDWARDPAQNSETLAGIEQDRPDVHFMIAHDGALFVASIDEEPGSPQAFAQVFWDTVSLVREAGARAIERIVDRTESKAAAEKFISSFMRGER